MNALVDKSQVEKQFSRAANSYNSAASVQKQMSDQLIRYLDQKLRSGAINTITDLGCGTGLSLHELSKIHPEAALTAVDISPSMLAKTEALLARTKPLAPGKQPDVKLICEDMEEYIAPVAQDLIFSNASIQWCDFRKVLDRVHKSLGKNGVFAFSSFGPLTHKELATAWQTVDGREHRIDFMTLQEHITPLKKAGFIALQQKSEIHQLRFDNAEALLDSIKKTGATNAARNRVRGLLSRDRYKRFLTELEKNQPLSLSYESLSFLVQKL